MPTDTKSAATKVSTPDLLDESVSCIRDLADAAYVIGLRAEKSPTVTKLARELMTLAEQARRKLAELRDELATEERDADFYADRDYAVAVGK
jgi:protein-disulfide isomerase-like protein with CxxC motif